MKKKAKKKLVNKTVSTYIWAVLLVVLVPALYIIFFVAQANQKLNSQPSTIQGYKDQETCREETNTDCYEVTTIQEDRYFIPNN